MTGTWTLLIFINFWFILSMFLFARVSEYLHIFIFLSSYTKGCHSMYTCHEHAMTMHAQVCLSTVSLIQS